MTFATSLNASFNDWLSNLAAGRKEALWRGRAALCLAGLRR